MSTKHLALVSNVNKCQGIHNTHVKNTAQRSEHYRVIFVIVCIWIMSH